MKIVRKIKDWFDKWRKKKEDREFEMFTEILQAAFNAGYRERYIKKFGCVMYEKDGIYFNKSGIYTYANGQFMIIIKKPKDMKKILKYLKIEVKE